MAKRNMRTEGDEILHKTSKKVEVFDFKLGQLLDDMADTLEQYSGVGLAGVQVGVLKRVFILSFEDEVTEFVNPEILERSGSQTGSEGCLSFPGKWGIVTRPNWVKVRAQNRKGHWFEVEGSELFARAVCHEYDHLDGVVYVDRADRMLTPEELDDMENEGE
ncbi:MAG: peptide deformylase [Angelakisella sp.]